MAGVCVCWDMAHGSETVDSRRDGGFGVAERAVLRTSIHRTHPRPLCGGIGGQGQRGTVGIDEPETA